MASPPPPSPPPPDRTAKPSDPPLLSDTSKKKSRLQWDEDNLISNAQEMERAGPRMKIDEPKTPYVASEAGSSTSGSAHQSPPESPFFLPGDQLHGFGTLEDSMRGPSSDGASSASSAPRSVHIDEGAFSSGGSSPRSKELFAARRKAHYRNEAVLGKDFVLGRLQEAAAEDDNNRHDSDHHHDHHRHADDAPPQPNGHAEPNGVVEAAEAGGEPDTPPLHVPASVTLSDTQVNGRHSSPDPEEEHPPSNTGDAGGA